MSNYNGWTNYATWRINLEIFDGMQFDEKVEAEYLKEIAEEIVFADKDNTSLCASYAYSFVSEVNFYEIANHINEEFEEINYI